MGTSSEIARQKHPRNLCPWIQFWRPNFWPGNGTALIVIPTIGYSRALVLRVSTPIGQIAFFPASACLGAVRNSKACRLAHVPAQLFHDLDRKRRKREGGARTYATLELSVHAGNLFSGQDSGQAGRSTSGYSDDRPLE